MKRCYLLALVLLVFAGAAQADVLWFNGDVNEVNGLSNEINTAIPYARTYDDFVVPSGGWVVDSLWVNDYLQDTNVSEASWEIRSGVSLGNGGNLVASGSAPITPILNGTSAFGIAGYYIEINGLSVPLDAGTYWLALTPIDGGVGRSWLATTSGLNAIGSPPGNNANSFFDSPYFSYNFGSASAALQIGPVDFSMGVEGTPARVPEPCTLALFGLAGFGLLRRRSSKDK